MEVTESGLYCGAGRFHVDPWKPVDRAVITHAHADHFVWGCGRYLTSPTGALCLRARLPKGAVVDVQPWREPVRIGDVLVSLHPAGHVLGSAQVKLAPSGGSEVFPTTVVTGDHASPSSELAALGRERRDLMATMGGGVGEEVFEPVRCDLLVTESTFGLPIFRWRDPAVLAEEVNGWWRENAASGRTSVLYAYALGKTQRLLTVLDASIGPIGLHGSALKTTAAYASAGVRLPSYVHANAEHASVLRGRGVIVAPGSADNSRWLRRFKGPEGLRTAYVSGWMAVRGKRRWRAADRGFALSDHADWPGLLRCVEGAGAERVAVTHGYSAQLSRYLNERGGVEAFTAPTRYTGSDGEAGDEAVGAEDAAVVGVDG